MECGNRENPHIKIHYIIHSPSCVFIKDCGYVNQRDVVDKVTARMFVRHPKQVEMRNS